MQNIAPPPLRLELDRLTPPVLRDFFFFCDNSNIIVIALRFNTRIIAQQYEAGYFSFFFFAPLYTYTDIRDHREFDISINISRVVCSCRVIAGPV